MLAQNLDNIRGKAGVSNQLNLEGIQEKAGLRGIPNNLGEVISNTLPWIFGIAGFLLLIYMVTGGLQLMTSRGDPKAVAAAQAKITNALLGFVIVLISAGLVVLLGRILNINVFSGIFK